MAWSICIGLAATIIEMSQVNDILIMIDRLSATEREELDNRLAERLELQWRLEAQRARKEASERGIDQGAIDRAIDDARYAR